MTSETPTMTTEPPTQPDAQPRSAIPASDGGGAGLSVAGVTNSVTTAPEAVEKSGSGVGDENARASMECEGASRVVRSACKPAPPRDYLK